MLSNGHKMHIKSKEFLHVAHTSGQTFLEGLKLHYVQHMQAKQHADLSSPLLSVPLLSVVLHALPLPVWISSHSRKHLGIWSTHNSKCRSGRLCLCVGNRVCISNRNYLLKEKTQPFRAADTNTHTP